MENSSPTPNAATPPALTASTSTSTPAASMEVETTSEKNGVEMPSTEKNGLEENESNNSPSEAVSDVGNKKKKKKNKKKNKKAKEMQAKKEQEEFNVWCAKVLEDTAKQVEGVPEETLHKMPAEFENTIFTGTLRPHYVTPKMSVPESIPAPDYAVDGFPRSEQESRRSTTVHVHTPEEVEILRDTCKAGREVMEVGRKFLRAGVTADEVDRIIYQATIDREAYPSPLNYNNFPKSVCVSVNEVICHGIPDCRVIQEGDIVNLDISIYKNGFHADLNETFIIGKADEHSKELVKTAYECLRRSSEMIRPRTMYREVGPVISKVAAGSNMSVVRSYCGHGIGRLFHTAPNVPHYNKNKAVGIMRPGHVFTIEPMINAGPNWRDELWPDNWTAVTSDGSRSAQFEHTFVVTEEGVEILTARPGTDIHRMPDWDEEYCTRPGNSV